MNVKELKKLAEEWGNTSVGSVKSADTAWAIYQAIMALPDDPQAEHEDLVEMAQIFLSNFPDSKPGTPLARAVIERFGKREPRKYDVWCVMKDGRVLCSSENENDARVALKDELRHDSSVKLARLTGTEEV